MLNRKKKRSPRRRKEPKRVGVMRVKMKARKE